MFSKTESSKTFNFVLMCRSTAAVSLLLVASLVSYCLPSLSAVEPGDMSQLAYAAPLLDHAHNPHLAPGHVQTSVAAAGVVAPQWLLALLALVFFSGFLFYLFRLCFPDWVKKAYGYWDWENEIGHGLCMIAMAAMLLPGLIALPAALWVAVLGGATSWFVVRSMSWGRRLPFNKLWYDLVHATMLACMTLMFLPLSLGPVFALLQGAFWIWFIGYYIYELLKDVGKTRFLDLGSNLAHLFMGIAMLVMIIWPAYLMPGHAHHAALDSAGLEKSVAAVKTKLEKVGDDELDVLMSTCGTPLVVLIFGGCENCVAEVGVLERVASEYGDRVRFVIAHKDAATRFCSSAGIDTCPTLVLARDGKIVTITSKDVISESEIRRLVEESIAAR